jgi:ferredoxin-NADP reductase
MHAPHTRLLAALVHPRPVEDFIQLAAPLWSRSEIRARVLRVRPETHDVSTLVLEPNALWPGHRAGQHVLLSAEASGVRRTRCFSVASSPLERGRLELTIKARPGGAVTPHLVSPRMQGAVVVLSPPRGDFVLPEPVPERVLFASGGSGITPVMSMLRTLVRAGHRGEIVFSHWARSERDVIFAEELARLATKGPANVRVHVRTGPLAEGALSALVPDLARRETWACGPAPFMAAVRTELVAAGAEARLHTESFGGPPPAASEEGSVTFSRSGARAEGKGTLLVLAEGAGLSPQSGCRMGICHTCTCRKVRGTTRDLRTGELSSDEGVDIQLCVNAAVGPVEVDL